MEWERKKSEELYATGSHKKWSENGEENNLIQIIMYASREMYSLINVHRKVSFSQ